MPLRIACDLDGTVADMEAALQHEAERLFGDVDLRADDALPLAPLQSPANFGDSMEQPASDAAPAPARRSLTDRERRLLWAHVGGIDGFWEGLAEIEPGSVSRLASLAAAHRWEVLFVTQRPEGAGDTPQVQSQRWLRAHGFDLPSVFVMQGSRGKLADVLGLDAVIDDRPDNCLDVVTESTARAILVWRQDRSLLPAGTRRGGIVPVPTFVEALDELGRMMAARRKKRASLIGRIRNAIRS
jgi:hypothetical protein